MYGLCQDCSTSNEGCPLYIAQSPEGFMIICCIVCVIEYGLSILAIVDLDFGGGSNVLPDL